VRSGSNGTYTVRVRRGNTTVSRTVEIGVRGDASWHRRGCTALREIRRSPAESEFEPTGASIEPHHHFAKAREAFGVWRGVGRRK
jgi:hypothetical protein